MLFAFGAGCRPSSKPQGTAKPNGDGPVAVPVVATNAMAKPTALLLPTAIGRAVVAVPADAVVISVTRDGASPNAANRATTAALEAAPDVGFGTLASAIVSAVGAGFSRLYLVVDNGGARGGLAIAMPTHAVPKHDDEAAGKYPSDREPVVDAPPPPAGQANVKVRMPTGSDADESSLKPNEIMRKIRGVYLPGLKRCHNQARELDPHAGGKVKLEFRVDPSGRLTKVKVSGFDATVDLCIKTNLLRWRFDKPLDEDGEPIHADFTITLVLSVDSDEQADEPPPPEDPPPPPEIADPQLVVMIIGERLVVFSATGLTGTLQKPLLELPADAGAFDSARLTEAVTFVSDDAPAGTLWPITLSFSDSTTVQTIVDVIVAVSYSSDGRRLFADPMLSSTL